MENPDPGSGLNISDPMVLVLMVKLLLSNGIMRAVFWSRKFSFGFGPAKPHIRIATSAPAPAPDGFLRYLENRYLFDFLYVE